MKNIPRFLLGAFGGIILTLVVSFVPVSDNVSPHTVAVIEKLGQSKLKYISQIANIKANELVTKLVANNLIVSNTNQTIAEVAKQNKVA